MVGAICGLEDFLPKVSSVCKILLQLLPGHGSINVLQLILNPDSRAPVGTGVRMQPWKWWTHRPWQQEELSRSQPCSAKELDTTRTLPLPEQMLSRAAPHLPNSSAPLWMLTLTVCDTDQALLEAHRTTSPWLWPVLCLRSPFRARAIQLLPCCCWEQVGRQLQWALAPSFLHFSTSAWSSTRSGEPFGCWTLGSLVLVQHPLISTKQCLLFWHFASSSLPILSPVWCFYLRKSQHTLQTQLSILVVQMRKQGHTFYFCLLFTSVPVLGSWIWNSERSYSPISSNAEIQQKHSRILNILEKTRPKSLTQGYAAELRSESRCPDD